MVGKKHGVLIADDYEADRFFLKETIRRHAPLLEVVGELDDGDEVIDYLQGRGAYADRLKHPLPELLIMDVRMPRMPGTKVVEWLKTHDFPSLKVALLGDSSCAKYRDEALGLGLKHFYSKTQSLEEFVGVVKKLQAELESGPAAPGPAPADPAEIPALVVEDLRIESMQMPVAVVWNNREVSRFFSLPAAKAAIVAEHRVQENPRAHGARIFAWDGKDWKETLF